MRVAKVGDKPAIFVPLKLLGIMGVESYCLRSIAGEAAPELERIADLAADTAGTVFEMGCEPGISLSGTIDRIGQDYWDMLSFC